MPSCSNEMSVLSCCVTFWASTSVSLYLLLFRQVGKDTVHHGPERRCSLYRLAHGVNRLLVHQTMESSRDVQSTVVEEEYDAGDSNKEDKDPCLE